MSSAQDPYEAIKARERGDGLELTGSQALQSIAVELHRANVLKGEELRLRVRSNDLVANVIDLLRKGPQMDSGMTDAIRELSRGIMEPLGAMMAHAMMPKPPRVESLPGPPPTIESEKDGTRVTQQPED